MEAVVTIVRSLTPVVAVFAAVSAACILVGAVIAVVRSTSYLDAVAYSMCVGGALILLVAATLGSPTKRLGLSRQVIGTFVEGSDIGQPEKIPVVVIPAAMLVIALGVLIYMFAA